jgi:hypothetical protein
VVSYALAAILVAPLLRGWRIWAAAGGLAAFHLALEFWRVATGNLGIPWIAISALMMLAAHLWLRRFPQGPFEWVWRTLVELPFARSATKVPAVQQ